MNKVERSKLVYTWMNWGHVTTSYDTFGSICS